MGDAIPPPLAPKIQVALGPRKEEHQRQKVPKACLVEEVQERPMDQNQEVVLATPPSIQAPPPPPSHLPLALGQGH
jgi:hypothetical protein